MKRLIGNAIGLIVFLFLIQIAIGMVPAVASATQDMFKQLLSGVDFSYSTGEVPLPDFTPPAQEPLPTEHPIPTETSAPIESPGPTITPLPEVTVDPVVPTPAPTITWICPIVGEGGC